MQFFDPWQKLAHDGVVPLDSVGKLKKERSEIISEQTKQMVVMDAALTWLNMDFQKFLYEVKAPSERQPDDLEHLPTFISTGDEDPKQKLRIG